MNSVLILLRLGKDLWKNLAGCGEWRFVVENCGGYEAESVVQLRRRSSIRGFNPTSLEGLST